MAPPKEVWDTVPAIGVGAPFAHAAPALGLCSEAHYAPWQLHLMLRMAQASFPIAARSHPLNSLCPLSHPVPGWRLCLPRQQITPISTHHGGGYKRAGGTGAVDRHHLATGPTGSRASWGVAKVTGLPLHDWVREAGGHGVCVPDTMRFPQDIDNAVLLT